MKLKFLVMVVLFCLVTVKANATEIHAPWSPGESWDYDRTTSSYHSGDHDNCVDFNKNGGTDEGSPILSISDGEVITSGWSDSYGWHVWIEQSDGSQDLYAHFDQTPFVKVKSANHRN